MSTITNNDFTRPFDQKEYDKWVDGVDSSDLNTSNSEKQINIDRMDLSQHSDTNAYHTDNHSNVGHINVAASHKDNHANQHTDNSYYWYENGDSHNNIGPIHADATYVYNTTDSNGEHKQLPGHTNTYVGEGYQNNHSDTHGGPGGHSHYGGGTQSHVDGWRPKYSKVHSNTGHNDSIAYNQVAYNQSGYTQNVPYSNYYNYNNQHVNLTNYIPAQPHFYELEDSIKRLMGTVDIRFHSLDATNYGKGDQLQTFKEGRYKLEIRQISDLDGAAGVTSWQTLMNFTKTELYKLNTKNYKDGVYELRVTPDNPNYRPSGYPSKTYEFVGEPKISKVRIEQNNDSAISVTNNNEFIKFTFGPSNAASTDKSMIDYGNTLYKNAPVDKTKGVFVEVIATDKDSRDYMKGSAKLYDGNNNVISTSKIIWSNGSEIIKSDGQEASGYVFFPLGDLMKGKYDSNAIVELTLQDYLDEACLKPSGGTIVQRKVSTKDSTLLNVILDNLEPTVTLKPNTTEWTNKDVIITIDTTDQTGMWKLVNPNFTEQGGSVNTSSKYTYVVEENGVYTFEAYDRVGNKNIKAINVLNIDKEPPIIETVRKDIENITINVSDILSGVKDIYYQWSDKNTPLIDYKNANVAPGNGFAKINNKTSVKLIDGKPLLHVIATDKAGNINYSVLGPFYKLQLNNYRITNVVYPPQKYMYPLRVVDMPVGVKSGYNVSLAIDVLGQADRVWAELSEKGGKSLGTVELKQLSGDDSSSTWGYDYATDLKTPKDTIIVSKIIGEKGDFKYDFNAENKWDGVTLKIVGSAESDILIYRKY